VIPEQKTTQGLSIRHLDQIDEGSRLAWLRAGVVIALLGYAFSVLAELLGTRLTHQIWSEALIILLLVVALWMVQRGALVLAAYLTLASIWLEIHLGLFYSGSMEGTGISVLPVLVAGAGILLGGRAALGIAVTSSLSVPAAVFLGRAFVGAQEVFHWSDLKAILNLAAIFIGMAVIISFGLRYLGSALSAARRNERRFSDLVAGNPDGILALDHRGHIEDLNPAAEALLGISLKEARGKRLEELPLDTDIRLSGVRSGPGFNGPSLPGEQTLTRSDGSQSRVEVVRQPLTRPDGTEGLMLLLRDITERRRVEDRATQFGRMVEEARSEIYVFHRDTLEILMANGGARENLGYDREEIRGMAMFQVQPTLSPETGRTLAQRLFEGGEEVVTLHTIHHRKDGSGYPLEIRYQKGTLEGEPAILAFGTDITEIEEAEEEQRLLQAQLQHAQKMEAVGLLAGGVAHDFNNLLTVIGGCGEILLDIGNDEVKDLTWEILEAQERGAALTHQLLAFARRDIVHVEDLSLSEVVRASEVLIRRVLGEKIQLDLLLDDEPNIRGDRGQIEQILLNLAGNARDAMEGGGRLTIRVKKAGGAEGLGEAGDFVALSVEDTGHGMDSPTLARVFEPFYTTKPRGKGTGLGLSTVHGIVTQNGGRIHVDSEPGQGTRIRVLWPPAQPDLEPGAGEGGRVADHRGTILVAEDEEGARTLIETILEREGYQVLSAQNGGEAVEIVRDSTRSLDLLLTDIVMPGVNGLELAEQVRELRPGLPILFMSGFVDAHLQGPEGKPGSLNLLAKPFRPPELRRRVREILHDESRISTP